MTKKVKAPPPESLTQAQIEEQPSFGLENQSLEERAKAQLSPEFVKVLKKIAYYTSKVGLPLNEVCQMLDVDLKQFEEDMKLKPIIGQIIRVKELEYKKDLLYTLSQRARSGDDKLAQWLLERKYPEEYGEKKKGGNTNPGDDVVEIAMKFIRSNGDERDPLVQLSSGKSNVVKKKSQTLGTYERAGDILDALVEE